VDQFINALGGLLGASLSTIRGSIGELDDVLVGLGALSVVAIILLFHEIKPAVQKRWHAGEQAGHRPHPGYLHHRH
jgi:hypothetical protein